MLMIIVFMMKIRFNLSRFPRLFTLKKAKMFKLLKFWILPHLLLKKSLEDFIDQGKIDPPRFYKKIIKKMIM